MQKIFLWIYLVIAISILCSSNLKSEKPFYVIRSLNDKTKSLFYQELDIILDTNIIANTTNLLFMKKHFFINKSEDFVERPLECLMDTLKNSFPLLCDYYSTKFPLIDSFITKNYSIYYEYYFKFDDSHLLKLNGKIFSLKIPIDTKNLSEFVKSQNQYFAILGIDSINEIISNIARDFNFFHSLKQHQIELIQYILKNCKGYKKKIKKKLDLKKLGIK